MSISFTTLTQALDNNLSETNGINYLSGGNDESSVCYKDLKGRALGILFHLQQSGIKPGDQLIVHTANNEFFLDAFWAGLYGGIIPVPVTTASNDEHRFKLLRILKQLETPWIYTNTKSRDQLITFCEKNNLDAEAEQVRNKCILIESIEDISQLGQIFDAKSEDTAFIQFSSGSTSDPKGVVLTHKNLITTIRAIIDGSNLTSEDRFFSWMPLTHDMGMIGNHLTPVALCADLTLMDTSVFVRRPLLWLTKASEKKSTILCSPNFGYKHFLKVYEAKGIDKIDLANVRLIFNGAEPISIELCEQFLSTMSAYGLKSNTMFPVYGLAEASLAVSFPVPGEAIKTTKLKRSQLAVGDEVKISTEGAMTFVHVGKAVRDCEIRITDIENNPLRDHSVGKIQLKGGNVTKGYYRAEEINRQLITTDGWLDTGDLGVFVDGDLIITGRIKDIIFVNGLNLYSHDLENILHNLGQLELGKVVATGARKQNNNEDELIIFILHRGDIESFIPLVKEVNKLINEQTGAEVKNVVPVKRIPKTTSGKIQRHLLNNEYINGEFDAVLSEIHSVLHMANNTHEEIVTDSVESSILQICNATISDKNITLDDNLFEIGISSLALADIHEQLEESFPGKIDISDLFDHPTVRELAVFLEVTDVA
ncbi:Polyketide synthase modules and related proteins [hydrothermal vent metagenome]|uniref:Polyketide synthase modules and related proteins n=1 Tax=hydrothermal vent metagenome TaxID=652676 RepID=A0A3B0X8P7_9ZZZZ